jgi:hypothetical protein
MIDFSYPLRALVGQIQHAHSYAKSIETAHFGRIYTDGFNLGYDYIFEPIVKPALDFARNHKVATSIVGAVFVFAYLAHRTRPEIDSDNKRVNGDEGDGSGTDTEGAESEGEGKRTRNAKEAGTKTPESERSEGEGEEGGETNESKAAAKPPATDKKTDHDADQAAPDAPPASGTEKKEAPVPPPDIAAAPKGEGEKAK